LASIATLTAKVSQTTRFTGINCAVRWLEGDPLESIDRRCCEHLLVFDLICFHFLADLISCPNHFTGWRSRDLLGFQDAHAVLVSTHYVWKTRGPKTVSRLPAASRPVEHQCVNAGDVNAGDVNAGDVNAGDVNAGDGETMGYLPV